MKNKILLLVALMFISFTAFSQTATQGRHKDKDTKRKEMLEFKLKFLSEEIDLKDSQKKQFYDLYSQMESERRTIFKKLKKAEKSISENKNASEADYEKANKEINEAKTQMSQVEKQYDEKFSTFLSKKQMYKLKEAETKFMEKMRTCRDKKLDGKKGKK